MRELSMSLRWLSVFTAAAGVMSASASTEVAESTQAAEYKLKAALVYRTANIIEWPNTAFAAPKSPFVVCVVGDLATLAAFRALATVLE
jgi:hypothetical protein